VRAVVEGYVAACRSGDVVSLRRLFHPGAVMSGYLAGGLLVGSPEPFFEAVAGSPSPAESQTDYRAEICDVVVSGRLGTATLKEQGFLGMDFINYFQIIQIEDDWKIVAKLFESA